MPLALLLDDQLSFLTKGLKRVEHWDTATETFSLVVDRLRSAYLVHWFGTTLPTVGVTLRVAFANMHELRRRWLAVGADRAGETPAIGPNLTEPLMGMGGTLAGIFASPLNSALLGVALGALVRRGYVLFLAIANWLTLGLLGTAGLGAAAGGVVLGSLAWAISGQPREGFDFLGAIAELVEPLTRFWRQVTGPREAVRNPLLREILILGDRVAALLAFLLGAFAVLVTRVGPLLEPMNAGFIATINLALDLWTILSLALRQTTDFLKGLLSGEDSIPAALGRVFALISRTFRRLGARLGAMWATSAEAFSRFAGASRGEVVRWWWATGNPFVRSQTVDHPTVRYLRSFAAELGVMSAWRARTAPPPGPPAPPSPPGMLARAGAWLLRRLGMPATTPTLPGAPTLPPLLSLRLIAPLARVTHLLQATGFLPGIAPNPLELGREGRAVLRRAERTPSVFAGEWAALRAEARRPEPLERALDTAVYLSIAERIVSPGAAESVRKLAGLLSRLDESIRAQGAALPVKDVPEPDHLTPVIRRLRVRAPGGAPGPARAWVEELRRELAATPYPVPAEA
jgi:hypothetical protein